MTTYISRLLNRGAEISIVLGRLVVRSPDGQDVPESWMNKYSLVLQREILTILDKEAYEYEDYSTGKYGPHKAPGVTVQFRSVRVDTNLYTIFNAVLTRSRNTKAGKKGSALPDGQFHVGKRSHFYRFWQSSGLKFPKRLSSFHDYMGNLKGILFTATMVDGHKKRLDKESLHPLAISRDEVRRAFQPDKGRANTRQVTDIYQTRMTDKDLPPAQRNRGTPEQLTTGSASHGKTVISTHEHAAAAPPTTLRKRPEEQTNEEWLADCFPPDDYTETPPHGSWQWS